MSSNKSPVAVALAAMLATASFIALATTSAPAATQSSAPALHRATQPGSAERLDRLIIRFRQDSGAAPLAQGLPAGAERVQALGARALPAMAGTNADSLTYLKSVSAHTHVARTARRLSHAELSALAHRVAQDPRVEYAEVDERVYPHFVPNDSLYASSQWNLKSPFIEAGGANLPNAWGRSANGAPVNGTGVTVAVLDSGYRPHADLVANIAAGYDFISQDNYNDFTTANDGDGRDADPLDPGDWNTQAGLCDVANSSWHGTHVAGIIGAVGNNGAGIIGIAHGAKLQPLRVLGVCGGYTSDTAAAIHWAAGLAVPGVPTNANPAKVISMSFGRDGACSLTYQAAITAARNAGSVVVVSTGNNSSKTTITQPSNCPGVIAVTAHDHSGANSAYANTGSGTTISAPGNNIYFTDNSGTTAPGADSYHAGSGTSYSAPQVAGVAALLVQIKPAISPAEVQSYLTDSARPHPSGSYCFGRSDCGAGLLDAFKATQALLQAQGIANAPPVLNALPTQYVLPGASLRFTATATDAEGDEVAFLGSGLPAGATFSAASGVFSWSPAQPAGDYTFVIQPTDGSALGASVSVKISVTTAIPVLPVVPVVPPVPETPVVPPLTVTPIAPSGGGGGDMGWIDLLGAVLLLSATHRMRRAARAKRMRQQHGEQSA